MDRCFLGNIIVLLLAVYAYFSHDIANRMEEKNSFSSEHLTIPADSTSIASGKHPMA